MKKTPTPIGVGQLKIAQYVGPLVMLVLLFYILQSVFNLNVMLSGVIAIGVAAFEFAIFSFILKRQNPDNSDRIG